MKKIIFPFVAGCCFAWAFFFSVKLEAQTPKSITLDDCFSYFKFYPQTGSNFQYLSDGLHYAEADYKGVLHIRDVRDAKSDSILTLKLPDEVKGLTSLNSATMKPNSCSAQKRNPFTGIRFWPIILCTI